LLHYIQKHGQKMTLYVYGPGGSNLQKYTPQCIQCSNLCCVFFCADLQLIIHTSETDKRPQKTSQVENDNLRREKSDERNENAYFGGSRHFIFLFPVYKTPAIKMLNNAITARLNFDFKLFCRLCQRFQSVNPAVHKRRFSDGCWLIKNEIHPLN
jgi:hypothetical protein